MTTILNVDGQPELAVFNRARRTERDISEFLGLAKGLLADGEISSGEADAVRQWIASHPAATAAWPINRIACRLAQIYEDGHADEIERRDLAELMALLVGGQGGMIGGQDTATQLPLDQPPPLIVWPDRVFVFTGQMAFGPRAECMRHVKRFGGVCDGALSTRTNYLVIGTFGSRDWAHTSFGRKIEKALKYRSSGYPLAIISEDWWAEQLPAHVSGTNLVPVRFSSGD